MIIYTILSALAVLSSIALVVTIVLQEQKESGLGSAFTGGSGMSGNALPTYRTKTKAEKLVRWTAILAIIFAVLAIALIVIRKFV